MTLGDKVYEFTTKYIKRTQIPPEEKKTIEDDLSLPPEYASSRTKLAELTPEKRRNLALQSGLFMKGSIKKNSDTFRAWFLLKQFDGVKVPQQDLDLVRAFELRSQIKKKFKIAGICADIWGDGYLLIKFLEDDSDKKLQNPIPTDATGKNTVPLDVIVLNPEWMTEIKYSDDKKNYYYHYQNPQKGDDKLIHPDRILHVKTIDLPFDFFGVSKVDILVNILASSADIDIATGEILKWFAHGTQILTKTGMQKNERKKALELMEKHPNFFAFSEKYTFDIKNPTAINPTPFYDHITESISAALIIPRQVLLGIEVGRVTGAEIGFADYYRDIKDNQDLVYTPLILRLYDLLAKANDRDFSKYTIEWETTYIDELAEADLIGKRSAAAVNLRSANPPIVSIPEARRIINEGLVELDPNAAQEPPKPVAPIIQNPNVPPPKNPPEGPQPPVSPDRLIKPVSRQMTDDEKEMISALKELELYEKKLVDEKAKKERELGKKILEEQEKL